MGFTPEQLHALRAQFLEVVHTAYGYEVHEDIVREFHASNAKTKIVSCPARTSKSYAGWKDVLPDVFMHGALLTQDDTIETQRIWIVAPNYDLAKEFDYAWEDLIERRETLNFDYEVVKAIKSPGQGNMVIQIRWGKNGKGQDVDTIIEVKSAANEKTLQSEEIDIAILSEAARLPEIVWSKYLSTRVTRSIFPTTPDTQAKWIWDLIEAAKKNPGLRTEHFQFTPRANPKFKYDRYWIEHQKAEARVDAAAKPTTPQDPSRMPMPHNGHDCFDPMVQCAAMKDAGFAEQFGGLWTFHRGRVVPLRTEESRLGEPPHVIRADREWFKHCHVHVAMDYGYTDPAVAGFWLVGPHQVVLRRSIYERGLTPDVFVDRVKSILQEEGWMPRLTRMIGDPKKPEVCELLRRRGLPIWDVDKKAQADRKAGHMELMNYLSLNPRTGEPFMLIHEDNIDVINEFASLRYNEKVRDSTTPNALIGRDDAYDMCRYFVMARPPLENSTPVQLHEKSEFENLRKQIVAGRDRRRLRRTVPGGGTFARIGM